MLINFYNMGSFCCSSANVDRLKLLESQPYHILRIVKLQAHIKRFLAKLKFPLLKKKITEK